MSSPVPSSTDSQASVEQIAEQLATALSFPAAGETIDHEVSTGVISEPTVGDDETLASRITDLTSQCNARARIIEGLETSVSGLTTQVLDLTARVATCDAAATCQLVNEAAQSTNTALEHALSELRTLITNLSARVDVQEQRASTEASAPAMASAFAPARASATALASGAMVAVQPSSEPALSGGAFIPAQESFGFRP